MTLKGKLADATLVLRARSYSGEGNWIDESPNGFEAVPTGTPVWDGSRIYLPKGVGFTIPHHTDFNVPASGSFSWVILARAYVDFDTVTNEFVNVMNKADLESTTEGELESTIEGYAIAAYRPTLGEAHWEMRYSTGNIMFHPSDPAGFGSGSVSTHRSLLGMVRDISAGEARFYFNGHEEVVATANTNAIFNTEDIRIGLPIDNVSEQDIWIWGMAMFHEALTLEEVLEVSDGLVGQTAFDPEAQYAAEFAWRATAYPGQDPAGDYPDPVDVAEFSDTVRFMDLPNADWGDLWNPDELTMEHRVFQHAVFINGGNPADSSFSIVMGFTRQGDGSLSGGSMPLAHTSIFVGGGPDFHGYILELTRHDWFLSAYILDEEQDDARVTIEGVPLEIGEKAGLAMVRDAVNDELRIHWLTRNLSASVASPNVEDLSVGGLRVVGQSSLGEELNHGVGDVNGVVWCRQALTEDQLLRVAAWIDPELLPPNVAVSATVLESRWAIGAPRS